MFAALRLAMWSAAPIFIGLGCLGPGHCQAPSSPNSENASSSPPNNSWLVRDPATGRIFRQQLVDVTVPVTQWESKPVTTTVYEPRQVVKNQTSQQVIYKPTTQYVMQPRLRGWWNPLRQPVQGYDFVPVTSWQPQLQQINTPVATTDWVPTQKTVYIQQPVQKMQQQQQLVQTEIPQPNAVSPYAPNVMMAAQPKPLISIPLLAKQRILPWPPVGSITPPPAYNNSPAYASTVYGAPSTGLRPIVSAANRLAPAYSAPLQTASTSASSIGREPSQAGMTATVLR